MGGDSGCSDSGGGDSFDIGSGDDDGNGNVNGNGDGGSNDNSNSGGGCGNDDNNGGGGDSKGVGTDNNQLKAAAEETVVGGPQEKMSFFQIDSGPILSIPIYLKTCLYGPCKFLLKKNEPFLTYEPPKVSVFLY